MARVESPSSINTYKQCPRKYYYQYIRKLESLPSIHLIRGKIVHAAIEGFFKSDTSSTEWETAEIDMQRSLLSLFHEKWISAADELGQLDVDIPFFEKESVLMLNNFLSKLFSKLDRSVPFSEAWEKARPESEVFYSSDELKVRGYIDAVEQLDQEVRLIDYKTSKKSVITESYRLQLAIYALLYYETHGVVPSKVGINFLKGDEQYLEVDEELLDLAKFEIENIHASTGTKEMLDYPKKISPLCKWSSGQCDFYDICTKE